MIACPVHLMTGRPCDASCARASSEFVEATVALAYYFRVLYGRPQPMERIVGHVCPGCGGPTGGGRRRYHGLRCRTLARQARRVAA